MKNSLISLLMVLCCAIFMGGCTSEHMNTTSCETLKLSSFKGVLHDSLIFKDRFVIALETNDASLIRKIDRLCLDRDTLAVFDRSLNKIVLFKNDGQHICTIHDVGLGPAEYVHVNDICMDRVNKRIVLLCDRPYKFMYYTYSGSFIKEEAYSFFCSHFVIKDDICCCYSGVESGDSRFVFYDNASNKVNKVRMPSMESLASKKGANTVMSNGNNLTKGHNAYFTRQFDNTIYVFSENNVLPKYIIDFQEHQMPVGLNRKYALPFEFIDECNRKKYVYSITEVAENDERLVFTTNLGFFLYDKESKELNGYRFIRNSNLNGGVSTIMTMNDGKHIAVNYKSSTFRRLIDSKMARGEKAEDDFLRVYNFIDDESNPILLVYPF